MTKLTILRGVSGSGKSTWAASNPGVVVSRDNIRLFLGEDEDPALCDHNLIDIMQESLITGALTMNYNVIVDDTNINWQDVMSLYDIGRRVNADVELKVFDLPLEKCLSNNFHRAVKGGREVPERVIRRQWQEFEKTKHQTLPNLLHK